MTVLRRLAPRLLDAWAGVALLYLFTPIFVIVAFSFNDTGRFNLIWQGFSLDAWKQWTDSEPLTDALTLSIKVAAVSTLAATVLGSLIALALVRHRFTGSGVTNLLLVLPLTTPEVVLGSSLLSLFIDLGVSRGFWTIVVAHTLFCVSYVAVTVKARIRGFDWTLEDAAMDLGAAPLRTFRLVTFPLILPGIVAAALLSFALSIDDFIITFFNSGNEQTFPLYIYAQQRRGLGPEVNVVATLVLVVSFGLSIASVVVQRLRARPA